MMRERELTPERKAQLLGYLDEAISETSLVGRIVSDLLAFSRRPSPQHGPANINEIVRKTVSLMDHKFRLAGVRIDAVLDDALPPVSCDASQIQQVVVNLLSNAAEAMPEGGVVTIRTGVSGDGDNLYLDVRDSGVGIPKELLGRIFDPFFTTKEEGKGTGLGLAVSYGIVSAHKGDIEVTSAQGRGTSFRVLLPLSPGPPAGKASSRDAAVRRGLWAT